MTTDPRSSVLGMGFNFRDKTEEPLPSGLEKERIIVGIDFGLVIYHHYPPLLSPQVFSADAI